jgi:hypothetical protein
LIQLFFRSIQVQMMRRQMAKLNHRLITLELENQQQNQRWQVPVPRRIRIRVSKNLMLIQSFTKTLIF